MYRALESFSALLIVVLVAILGIVVFSQYGSAGSQAQTPTPFLNGGSEGSGYYVASSLIGKDRSTFVFEYTPPKDFDGSLTLVVPFDYADYQAGKMTFSPEPSKVEPVALNVSLEGRSRKTAQFSVISFAVGMGGLENFQSITGTSIFYKGLKSDGSSPFTFTLNYEKDGDAVARRIANDQAILLQPVAPSSASQVPAVAAEGTKPVTSDTGSGTVTAPAVVQETVLKSDTGSCDQTMANDLVGKGGRALNLIRYSINDKKFYQYFAFEDSVKDSFSCPFGESAAADGILESTLSLDVSTVLPVSGFLLQIDNTGVSSERRVLFAFSGSRLKLTSVDEPAKETLDGVTVLAGESKYLLVTYDGRNYVLNPDGKVRLNSFSENNPSLTLGISGDYTSGPTGTKRRLVLLSKPLAENDPLGFSTGLYETKVTTVMDEGTFVESTETSSGFATVKDGSFMLSSSAGASYQSFFKSNVLWEDETVYPVGTASSLASTSESASTAKLSINQAPNALVEAPFGSFVAEGMAAATYANALTAEINSAIAPLKSLRGALDKATLKANPTTVAGVKLRNVNFYGLLPSPVDSYHTRDIAALKDMVISATDANGNFKLLSFKYDAASESYLTPVDATDYYACILKGGSSETCTLSTTPLYTTAKPETLASVACGNRGDQCNAGRCNPGFVCDAFSYTCVSSSAGACTPGLLTSAGVFVPNTPIKENVESTSNANLDCQFNEPFCVYAPNFVLTTSDTKYGFCKSAKNTCAEACAAGQICAKDKGCITPAPCKAG